MAKNLVQPTNNKVAISLPQLPRLSNSNNPSLIHTLQGRPRLVYSSVACGLSIEPAGAPGAKFHIEIQDPVGSLAFFSSAPLKPQIPMTLL